MLAALLSFSIWVVLCSPSNVYSFLHAQKEMKAEDRWNFLDALQVTFQNIISRAYAQYVKRHNTVLYSQHNCLFDVGAIAHSLRTLCHGRT